MKKFSSEKQKNKNNLQHPKTQSNISSTFKEGQKYPLKELVNKIKVGFVGSCNKYYCDSKNGIPMIRTTNLTDNGVNLENIKYVTEDFFNKNPKSQLHKGNILIARHGNNGLASIWTHNFKAQCLNIVIIEPNEKIMNNYYLYYIFNSALVQRQIKAKVSGSVQGVINTKDISEILIPYYKLDHQKKVSNVLLTMDTKIALMEQKNKKIKYDVKNYLLSNLFVENKEEDILSWNDEDLDNISSISTGNCDLKDNIEDGKYPFFVRSEKVERIDSYAYDGEAILIPGDGRVGQIFHYINGKFNYHQRVYKISDFKDVIGKYVYYYLQQYFLRHVHKYSVKGTVDSLRLPIIKEMKIRYPSIKKQEKIVNILSCVDKKIELSNKQIDLMKNYKKGLLQKMFI